jgi:hypothetical protein
LENDVTLPAAQQRTLDRIADGLRGSEPKRAAMYAIFTRLCSSEALPRREQLDGSRGRRTWRRALLASQVAISLVLVSVLVGVSWRDSGVCGSASGQRGAAYMRLWCPTPAQTALFPGK